MDPKTAGTVDAVQGLCQGRKRQLVLSDSIHPPHPFPGYRYTVPDMFQDVYVFPIPSGRSMEGCPYVDVHVLHRSLLLSGSQSLSFGLIFTITYLWYGYPALSNPLYRLSGRM